MNKNTVRWLLGFALVSMIGLAAAWSDRFDVAALQTRVESAGAAASLVFIALYAAATVLFQPGSVVTLAGGAHACGKGCATLGWVCDKCNVLTV